MRSDTFIFVQYIYLTQTYSLTLSKSSMKYPLEVHDTELCIALLLKKFSMQTLKHCLNDIKI